MSDQNASTLQSYVDSATGAIQSAIGSITGSTADKQAGEQKKEEAQVKDELSHATAKVGPYSATATGAVTKDDPNRTEGSWNQTAGSAKAAVGGLLGSESLKQQGEQQNREGKEQEARGQLSDLGQGVSERVQGAVGAAAAGLTGDRDAQEKYQDIHDAGKTRQRGAEADIVKQNEAS